MDVDPTRPPEEQSVEVWCNAVAAATLMPRDCFLNNEVVEDRKRDSWSDQCIGDVAKKFSVSREAVVRRLYRFGLASKDFYDTKRLQYETAWQMEQNQKNQKNKDKTFQKNPPQDVLNEFGRPFINLVLNSFYDDLITLSDVSSYLGIRIRHIPTIEQQLETA